MQRYDAIIIGTGQAEPALAQRLADTRPAENRWTMTAYRTLPQSHSVTRPCQRSQGSVFYAAVKPRKCL